MIIAIDYDMTYTADPDLFDAFIGFAKMRGHLVVIVTSRKESECDHDQGIVGLVRKQVTIYCTNGKAKKHYLHTRGVHPDIWIDDRPEFIFHDQESLQLTNEVSDAAAI
ncbi:MAG: hypothetical protein MJA29_07490 [Candidatus Omnitrophica bacterium]|nr:hypothetical protein [Candidatus Omnitrophota bacterium]